MSLGQARLVVAGLLAHVRTPKGPYSGVRLIIRLFKVQIVSGVCVEL